MANSSDRDLHIKYMSLALEQAQLGLYNTHPNPRVGCVITQNNRVIAEGYHHQAGQPHAEIMALRQATAKTASDKITIPGQHTKLLDAKLPDTKLYVTLEPCCHHGRTPPCTQAIIKAGIKEVYVAISDPNPKVNGKGIAELRKAGIEVHLGLLAEQAQQLNAGYWQRHQQARPWIRLKLATSLDGRITCLNQNTRLITNTAARQDVQHWRALSSAIVTGMNTLITDNPQLNVRAAEMPETHYTVPSRQPDLFIIGNTSFSIPQDARIFDSDRNIYLVNGINQEAYYKNLPAQIKRITVPYQQHNQQHSSHLNSSHLDLNELATLMTQLEINELLIEAGRGLSSSYLESGLVDQLILYQAPKLLGDQEKGIMKPSWQQPGIHLKINSITQLGQDVRYLADLTHTPSDPPEKGTVIKSG